MVKCTFAGHREVYGSGVEERLNLALNRMLEEDEEFCFYAGGMGEFDAMSARAVRVLRQHHPEKKIHLYLVLPYMKQSVNEDKLLKTLYDEIIIDRGLCKLAAGTDGGRLHEGLSPKDGARGCAAAVV